MLILKIFLLGKPEVTYLFKDSFFEQRLSSINIIFMISLFYGLYSKKNFLSEYSVSIKNLQFLKELPK